MNKILLPQLNIFSLFNWNFLFLFLFVLLIFPAKAQPQSLYKIELSYNKGEISVKNISKVFGFFQETKNQPDEAYSILLLDKNNNPLSTEKFNFPLILTDPTTQLDKAEKTIFALCNENTAKLKILSAKNELVLQKDLESCLPKNLNSGNFTPSGAIYFIIIFLLILIVFVIILIKRTKK